MSGHLLDTNVISELLTPRPADQVISRLNRLADIYLSSIVIEEIAYGVELTPPGRRRDQIAAFLSGIRETFAGRILPVREAEAIAAAQIEYKRKSAGRRVELADALIGGTALEHDLVIVTRNVKDYDGVGLKILNPWDDEI